MKDKNRSDKVKDQLKKNKENLYTVYKNYLLKLTPRLREEATRSIYNMSFYDFSKLVDCNRNNMRINA